MNKKNIDTPICAVDFAFRRIGGKYKGRILWYLHQYKMLRYGALRRSILDITPKMLTQTLRELEEDGLVHRAVYQEVPPRVEYTLTETGKELIPFINHLRKWGEKQMEKEGVPLIMTIACAEPGEAEE
jgi:DNA-binding HxlR family transcriptional regulator